MKDFAILEYTFMFEPTTTWQHGSQFENQLSDFFAANGYEANIMETKGGSGRRVIFLSKIELLQPLRKTPEGKQIPILKKINSAPKSWKEYASRGIPKSIVNQDKAPKKLEFQAKGRELRQKVRMP